MKQTTPVMPAAPTPPGASERPAGGIAGGVPDAPTSLLGPVLLGAACGWMVSSVTGGGVYSLVTAVAPVSLELAKAAWLAYLQLAVLLAVTGTLAIHSVWRKRLPRGQSVGMRLALFIAWVPYLSLFVLPRSILQLDVPRGIGGPSILSALQVAPLATLLAVGWLTGIIAVFVWGDPSSQLSRIASTQGRIILSRWLIIALVASVAFALVALLRVILLEILVVILTYFRHDPTCAGLCAPEVFVPHLIVPLLLSIALGVLSGMVGGVLRFGRASLRGVSVQPEVAATDSEKMAATPAPDATGASTPAAPYPRSLPGSPYWGSFLLGALGCGGWLLALYLSGISPLSAPVWRAPVQVVLLLALPIGVVVYAGRRLRRDHSQVLPAQAVFALLVVIAGLLVSLFEVLLLTGSNAGWVLLQPLFAPVVLPLFGPALSLGVAVGFAWGTRRPDARMPTVRLGGVGAALLGWVGFSLPLIGLVIWVIVTFYTHSIVCGSLGGCVLAGAIMLALFESTAIVALFGLPLVLFGLAIGRRLRLAASYSPGSGNDGA